MMGKQITVVTDKIPHYYQVLQFDSISMNM